MLLASAMTLHFLQSLYSLADNEDKVSPSLKAIRFVWTADSLLVFESCVVAVAYSLKTTLHIALRGVPSSPKTVNLWTRSSKTQSKLRLLQLNLNTGGLCSCAFTSISSSTFDVYWRTSAISSKVSKNNSMESRFLSPIVNCTGGGRVKPEHINFRPRSLFLYDIFFRIEHNLNFFVGIHICDNCFFQVP